MTAKPREFEDRPAVREQVPLLLGLVGPSGSGKTWSALRTATGIQRVVGGDIFGIDTEARRMAHYAEHFKFRHLDFKAPFGSADYLAAITHCVRRGAKVVIVDQLSSEHDGPGGMVGLHDAILDRMAGTDYQKRERMKMLAWSEPKQARRALINGILQLNCNFIFCFRAKSISKPVKQANGKTEVVPQGFVPIAGDEFVYEMTANVLLLPKSNGVPTWSSDNPGETAAMKLPQQFRGILDRPGEPLSEDVGERLARWAAGTPAQSSAGPLKADVLLDQYAVCESKELFDQLEADRRKLWKALKADAQAKLKAASEDAAKRIAPPDDGLTEAERAGLGED